MIHGIVYQNPPSLSETSSAKKSKRFFFFFCSTETKTSTAGDGEEVNSFRQFA